MKRCVAVLGPGRSGTSITMKLLHATGLRLSAELVPASLDNPDGHFEDTRIRDAHQRLLQSLRLSPYLPRPDDWMIGSTYRATRSDLIAIVTDEVGQGPGLWGFKEPRICVLWPLWQEVFDATNVTPTVVFCVRDSRDVIRSMMKAYDLPQDVAEGIYLYRTFHALEDVSEGWFFVTYNDWLTQAERQLRSLTAYCGLEHDAIDYGAIVATHYRPELDRQSRDAQFDVSGAIAEIDRLLSPFSGTSYDQEAIDAWCRSIENRLLRLRVRRYRSKAVGANAAFGPCGVAPGPTAPRAIAALTLHEPTVRPPPHAAS